MKRKIIFYFVISFVTIIFTCSIVFASGTISGKVTLQSRANHQNTVAFRLIKPGDSTPFKTYEVTTSSSGSYTISDIPQGTYNLFAKAPTFLSQTQVLIEVLDGQQTVNVDFSLLGGDANGDNSVAAADMIILRNAWLTSEGQPKYDPRADFNGDKSVATADMVILRSNWLKNGTEPKITITSPQDNSFTSNPTISVSGSFYSINGSSAVTIIVNDTPATITNNTFTADNIRLSEGKNRIYAIAKNQYNNKNADLITVTLDKTAPSTPLVTDDGEYSSSLSESHASWSSTDPESGIVEYRYSIGTTPGKADIVDWTSFSTQTEVTHKNLNLIQGQRYYFNLISTNGAGIESNQGYSDGIIANDATTLLVNITSPPNNSLFNRSPITVKGTVSQTDAQVRVNGITSEIINNNFTALNIPLTEGINILTARATNETQTAQGQIVVTLDTTPPAINILTPKDSSTTKSNIIYGRVSDDTDNVEVNGAQAELLENNYFLARPPLIEGQNTITITARDRVYNQSQTSLNITYNTTSPKVTITSPLDNSEKNTSPIKVEGTNAQDIKFIIVESQTALINDTNFYAEGIALTSPKTIITATGYNSNDNKFQDTILINSLNLSHYELLKVSGDTTEDDPNRPQAGSNHTLIVKLEKNNLTAPNEEIQFRITQGNGSLSSPSSFTDINGEATVTLTLDTNSDITNEVEAYPTNNLLLKTTFSIDTKPAQPTILTKITDDTQTPTPNATIPLIVKLTDQYNNPIPDEQINFQVTSGDGILSSPTATTNYYGEAKVNLTCPNIGLVLTQITASSNTVPSINTTFNITTSAPLTVTVDDIIAKVNENDQKIQDIKADITVTSDMPWSSPTAQLKIWIKGEKQKVQEISPNPGVYIRPVISGIIAMDKQIISYDPVLNIHIIKIKKEGQVDEYPYIIHHIDYNKGIIIKTEYHILQNDFKTVSVSEYSDFIQIDGAWGYQKQVDKIYGEGGKVLYTTTKIYSNIQINTSIPDSEFQE